MTQPGMTRLEFDSGLRLVRESLFSLTGTVTEAIQAATTALLDQNLEAARATASLELRPPYDPCSLPAKRACRPRIVSVNACHSFCRCHRCLRPSACR
jgi:hypothetical protein